MKRGVEYQSAYFENISNVWYLYNTTFSTNLDKLYFFSNYKINNVRISKNLNLHIICFFMKLEPGTSYYRDISDIIILYKYDINKH